MLVLFTVAAGALAGGRRRLPTCGRLCTPSLGTALVAAGASALNQLLERHTRRPDAPHREPAAAGGPAVAPSRCWSSASASAVGGVVYLAVTLRQPLAALVAGVTFVSYVVRLHAAEAADDAQHAGRRRPGGAAAGDRLDRGARRRSTPEALALFLILFLWQVPHFLAIAWIYREDYARAGLCMLPVVDRDGAQTGRQMVAYCLALMPVSLVPVLLGAAGPVYLRRGACALGLGFLAGGPGASAATRPTGAGPAGAAGVAGVPAGAAGCCCCWMACPSICVPTGWPVR